MVVYLGEINDTQQAAWLKTLDVFDEQEQRSRTLSLFPDDREIPKSAVGSLQVKLSGLELRRARAFGDCWLACELWRTLGLEEFWQARLPEGREEVPWEQVLRLLVVNRWIAPGSEFRVHRQWFVDSAMDELLGVDFAVAEKDRLYRCLDRLLAHKPELFVWLRQQWADLFHADFEVLLYDLTSTYFEGEMEHNPKAKRGYSRDGRPDCLQVVIALVITTDGFPLAYEVMDGTRRIARRCGGFSTGSNTPTARRSGCGSWIAEFRPRRSWPRCGTRLGKCRIWSARRNAKSPNTKSSGSSCPGTRSATRST